MEFRATRQKSEVYQTSVASEEVAFIVHKPEIEKGCHWLCGLPSATSLFWACLPIWKLDNKIRKQNDISSYIERIKKEKDLEM